MKRKRETEIMLEEFRLAGLDTSEKVKRAVDLGLKCIRREKYLEHEHARKDYQAYCRRKQKKQRQSELLKEEET